MVEAAGHARLLPLLLFTVARKAHGELQHTKDVGLQHGAWLDKTDAAQQTTLVQFVAWAQSLSRSKEVIVAYADSNYMLPAHNCIASLRRLGVQNAGVLAADRHTSQYMLKHDIPAYNVANIAHLPDDVQLGNTIVPETIDLSHLKYPKWSNRWNNHKTVRWAHWMLRHYLTLQLLEAGLGVFQTDVDVVFLENPYNWLNPHFDLEGQTQNWPEMGALNLGIGHIAASRGGRLHWATTNWMMRYTGDDAQSIENFAMIDVLRDQRIGVMNKTRCISGSALLCRGLTTPLVSLRWWPGAALPMAYQLPRDWNSSRMIGIHVHAAGGRAESAHEKSSMYKTWTRERGLWFV